MDQDVPSRRKAVASLAKKRLSVLVRQMRPVKQRSLGTQSSNFEVLYKHALKELLESGEETQRLEARRRLFAILHSKKDDLFSWEKGLDLSMEDKRKLIVSQIQELKTHKILIVEHMKTNPLAYFGTAEALTVFDPSASIKCGVHFTLFGGAVYLLGTEKHRRWVDQCNEMLISASFSLTELGHGSNARFVQTIAIYNPLNNSFIIHTPNVAAQKYFIGGSVNGTHTVVFAQLRVPIDKHSYNPNETQEYFDAGVQAFIVPLRDENGKIFSSIRIADCGHKMGLNGVDNGRIIFNQHEIPHENMLDKFGYVDSESCKYISPISSNTFRFASMIGALIYGRVGLTTSSTYASKLGLAVAIKYSAQRLQFGPPPNKKTKTKSSDPHMITLPPLPSKTSPATELPLVAPIEDEIEIPILDYLSHQRRLFPLLAKTIALHFAQRKLLRALETTNKFSLELDSMERENGINSIESEHYKITSDNLKHAQKKLHILAAGFKAVSSWHVNTVLSESRECCGGHGYLSQSRLGDLKSHLEIFTTFEGDNVVLLQQVAASLLKEFKDLFAKGQRMTGLFSLALDEVKTRVRDKNPATKRNTFKDHLLSSSFHMEALRFRKKRLVMMLASRLRAAGDVDFFWAWNDSLDLALMLAHAHMDFIIYKEFSEHLSEVLNKMKQKLPSTSIVFQKGGSKSSVQLNSTPDEDTQVYLETKASLKRIKHFYALTLLEQNADFYLQEHFFAASKVKAIHEQINELCLKIRPDAVALVESFQIPDFILPSLAKPSYILDNAF